MPPMIITSKMITPKLMYRFFPMVKFFIAYPPRFNFKTNELIGFISASNVSGAGRPGPWAHFLYGSIHIIDSQAYFFSVKPKINYLPCRIDNHPVICVCQTEWNFNDHSNIEGL
jgi:hypothetical protein